MRQRRHWLWVLVCDLPAPDLPPAVTLCGSLTGRTLTLHPHRHSFWSYEYCKRLISSEDDTTNLAALKILLCGGIAGVVTWTSVFPLDVIKTRLQAGTIETSQDRPLLPSRIHTRDASSIKVAREVYQTEGLKAFYRGLGVCSFRAFIVNAVQVCEIVANSRLDSTDNLYFSGRLTNGL